MLLSLPLGLTLTRTGLARGGFFAVKIALLAAAFAPMLRTTHPGVWGRVLTIPTVHRAGGLVAAWNRFALTLGLAVGFLPTLLTEAERTRQAQCCRGAFQGGWLARLKDSASLVTPLVASSLRRVDLVTDALQARGFQPDAPRTTFKPSRLGRWDMAALGGIILSVASYYLLGR